MTGFDETTKAILFKKSGTLKEAVATGLTVKDNSRGIIYDAQGNFMLRVPNNNEAYCQAKAPLDPALAEEVGKELMSMADDKGAKYIIKGLEP